jgi:protein-S-isoprenylcysteine O-methyltransferase Ste14
VVIAAVAFGIAGGFVLASSARGAAIDVGRWPIFIAGLVLMVAGIVLRQWSVLTLGRFFTTDVRVFSGQDVIDRGPYRWVAHPSYSGLLVTLCGIGLALGNGLALATITLVPGLGLLVRIRYEERTLTASLGEPYRRFLASRARLFPGLR